MTIKDVFVLSAFVGFIIYVLIKHVILPKWRHREFLTWLDSEPIQQAYRNLKELFKDADGSVLSKQDREALGIDAYELTYGEMPFVTFAAILATIEPKPDTIFYDLGSGTGKIVIAAALLHNFKACHGVELLPSLYAYSETRKAAAKKLTEAPDFFNADTIYFHKADYCDYDFSDADVIYVNATGAFGETWDVLNQQFNQLKPGTFIILTSKRLGDSRFKLIDARMRLMSWGMNRVFIYRKESN